MISAFLVVVSVASGVLAVATGAVAKEEKNGSFYAWAALAFMAVTISLSFIAGVLS